MAILQGFTILLNLTEDPGIRWGGSADHHGVASRGGHHGACVFRTAYIAISDHRNVHRVLYCGYPFPPSGATVALFARTSVQRHRAEPAILGNFRQLDADNLF